MNQSWIIASKKSWVSSLNGGMSVVSERPIDLQDHHKPVDISKTLTITELAAAVSQRVALESRLCAEPLHIDHKEKMQDVLNVRYLDEAELAGHPVQQHHHQAEGVGIRHATQPLQSSTASSMTVQSSGAAI